MTGSTSGSDLDRDRPSTGGRVDSATDGAGDDTGDGTGGAGGMGRTAPRTMA
ncbi:hypothetical protein ACIBF6_15585 [Streptosporangium amethystogenes]|uniref:hypothetical protein n=1 Tax=Streptosporangium amethystogenes TaxID=2002 RepID=UPI0037A8A491